MKRTLILIVSLFAAMILTACGNTSTDELTEIQTEAEVETDEVETQENKMKNEKKENEDTDESNASAEDTLSLEELEEIIKYNAIGEGDKLVSVALEDDEIKVVIDMDPQGLLPEKFMASTTYSRLSDELLKHEGWEILTVEFVDVGTVSMNRSEKESNEYGDYFPIMKIDEMLGIEY